MGCPDSKQFMKEEAARQSEAQWRTNVPLVQDDPIIIPLHFIFLSTLKILIIMIYILLMNKIN